MKALLFLVAVLTAAPLALSSQSFDEIAEAELRGLRCGFVFALFHEGRMSSLEAFGRTGPETEEPLTPQHLFAFPALTEVLLGATIQALSDAEVLDLDAPISRYMPLLSPGLGGIHLRQLLNHTSGLDDARVPEDQEWSRTMDLLNDRALFTQPGFIYSHSRYSFPLILRVVEKAVGIPFPEIVSQTILTPLGMTQSTFDPVQAREWGLVKGLTMNQDESSPYQEVEANGEMNGLPVLFTTATDVLRFLLSWMEGGIRGTPPWESYVEDDDLPGNPGGRNGLRIGRWEGHLRAYRTGRGMGMGSAFHIFPEAGTALVSWGIGSYPSRTTAFALDRIAETLGPGTLTQDERLDRAVERLGLDRIQTQGDSGIVEIPEPTQPHHDLGWAGTYLNGEYKVELRNGSGGLVYFNGEDELPATAEQDGSMVALRADGLVRVVFHLEVDRAGRRYVRLRNKAFLHTDDGG